MAGGGRKRLRVAPRMDAGARKWMLKHAQKNFWRVAAWYSLDDLIADGYMCYQHVRRRYPDVLDKPHIMRLFQRTYMNHIHMLANKRTAIILETVDTDTIDVAPNIDGDSELAIYIAELPEAERTLVRSMLTDPRHASQYRRRLDGTRETRNEKLRRITGLSNPTEVMKSLYALLHNM